MSKNEIMPHKFYVMKSFGSDYEVWPKEEYDEYIKKALSVGAGSAFKVVIGFNGDEDFLSHRPINDTKEDDKDFESYIQKARDEFVFAVTTHFPGTVTRIAAENILIAYDQIRDKLFAADEIEKLKAENLKLSSDLADAIRQRDMYQKICELKSGH